MVQRTVVELVDDLDSGPADESVRFTFDGKGYVIDLSSKNADKLRKLIAPYVASARRDSTAPRPSVRRGASTWDGTDARAVRAWAVSNGYAVSTRGRVSADLVAAFKAAGN
jgi:Lsr2